MATSLGARRYRRQKIAQSGRWDPRVRIRRVPQQWEGRSIRNSPIPTIYRVTRDAAGRGRTPNNQRRDIAKRSQPKPSAEEIGAGDREQKRPIAITGPHFKMAVGVCRPDLGLLWFRLPIPSAHSGRQRDEGPRLGKSPTRDAISANSHRSLRYPVYIVSSLAARALPRGGLEICHSRGHRAAANPAGRFLCHRSGGARYGGGPVSLPSIREYVLWGRKSANLILEEAHVIDMSQFP